MNETDLRRGLDDAVAAGSPPLALDATGMLAHARRQRRVRLAGVSAGGTVAAALTALGVVLALPGGAASGGLGAGGQPGCQPVTAVPTATQTQTATKLGKDGKPVPGQPTEQASEIDVTGGPSCPDPSETPWPDGQSDRTARSGPHFQQGVELQAALRDLVPAGFTVTGEYNQSQFEDYVGELQIWETQASAGLRKGSRTGTVLFENYTGNPTTRNQPLCKVAAAQFGGKVSDCETLHSGGRTVVFFGHKSDQYNPQIDQWAAYRDPTGALTYVAQSKSFTDVDHPDAGHPLTALPFTKAQLVALATNSRLGPG
jgi:hypothetical protein